MDNGKRRLFIRGFLSGLGDSFWLRSLFAGQTKEAAGRNQFIEGDS